MSHNNVCENPGVEGGRQTDVLMAQWVGKIAQSHIKSRKAPKRGLGAGTAVIAYLPCARVLWRKTKNQEPNSWQVAFVLRRRDVPAWTVVNYAVPWEAASFHKQVETGDYFHRLLQPSEHWGAGSR